MGTSEKRKLQNRNADTARRRRQAQKLRDMEETILEETAINDDLRQCISELLKENRKLNDFLECTAQDWMVDDSPRLAQHELDLMLNQ